MTNYLINNNPFDLKFKSFLTIIIDANFPRKRPYIAFFETNNHNSTLAKQKLLACQLNQDKLT